MTALTKALLISTAAWIGSTIWVRVREADLTGQVVFITGGSRGLGYILAQQFAREGCQIAICARRQRDLDLAQRSLQAKGAKVLAIRCDVSIQEQVEQAVQEVLQRFGRIDILVNNAGTIQVGPMETMRLKDYEQAMGTMFWGLFYTTMAVLPHMLERGQGRIVNITSIGGKVSVPHLLPYAAAKFASTGFSEGLRAELLNRGILVTTVIPGLMRTGSYLAALFKGRQQEEFTWFGVSGNLPGTSMDAERAAHQIITAVKRGQSEVILSIPAKLLARFHGLFPGLTSDILALVDALVLPGHQGGSMLAVRGMELQDRMDSSLFNSLTTLGRTAARQFNQVNEEPQHN